MVTKYEGSQASALAKSSTLESVQMDAQQGASWGYMEAQKGDEEMEVEAKRNL